MEPGNHYDFENEEQFWHELDTALSRPCDDDSLIDDVLRSYLTLATESPDHIQNDQDVRRCAFKLYSSHLFAQHADYVRTQFVHCLLQEEDVSILHIASTFLAADAREHEQTFQLMNDEGAFPRLIDLISQPRPDEDETLHRQLMELLYELARLQRISNEDLACIEDDFIYYLFNIIEQVSDDVEDPYHYPVIRVLLVLNEQFMVAAHDPAVVTKQANPLTNKVMKVLSAHGSKYKTFGENIILLLNREDETSLQLLTLKLLYLLFTTPPTYEYFYTNDVYVLLDILIRNLLDLPEEATPLRHTYLRVLYPLLEHTQLKYPPYYKRDEVRKLLSVLVGGHVIFPSMDGSGTNHFEDVDETTKRLVHRCQTVSWLRDLDADVNPDSPVDKLDSTSSPSKAKPPALPAPRKLRKRLGSSGSGSFLAPQLDSARQSSLSVAEIAAQKEKPGVITPSKNQIKQGFIASVIQKKEKPPPPKARRSGLGRFRSNPPATPEPDAVGDDNIASPDSVETDDRLNEQPQVPGNSVELNTEQTKLSKKPPPAPKTRRWGRRRVKDDGGSTPHGGEIVADAEAYQRQSDPPSIVVPSASSLEHEPGIYSSPFSPPEEKTLSPLTSHEVPGIDDQILKAQKKSKRISSVSAALHQAQAQALHDLEQSLEKATLSPISNTDEDTAGTATSSFHKPDSTAATTTSRPNRVILAPPGQAPIRSVPSPITTIGAQYITTPIDESPFLSDHEKSTSFLNYDSTGTVVGTTASGGIIESIAEHPDEELLSHTHMHTHTHPHPQSQQQFSSSHIEHTHITDNPKNEENIKKNDSDDDESSEDEWN